jgi:metallophosphoesterase (TIGR03767 family)
MSSDEILEFSKKATTLDVTIVPECTPSFEGTQSNYFKLTYDKGQKYVRRKDLVRNTKYPSYKGDNCNKCNFRNCKCKNNKNDKKCNKCKEIKCKCEKLTPLVSFVQTSDIHVIDAGNASRTTFLGVFVESEPVLSDAFRPNESLTMQTSECMVRKINAVERGPHLDQKFSFVICTGDNSDSQTINELQNYINILDGGEIVPNPASDFYTGVQDNKPTVAYNYYYHPDSPPPGLKCDMYKTDLGYPEYPNILNTAAKPFCASGLKVPWYAVQGNHDAEKIGNYGLFPYTLFNLFDQIAIGEIPNLGSKLIDFMSPVMAAQFALALQKQDAAAILDIINRSVLLDVPKSIKRRQFTTADFISAHFNTSKQPIGHGFTQRNIDLNVAYYTFKISENITGISLDTCNPSGNLVDINLAPNGSIGKIQLAWLEEELRKRHSNYYNSQGELVCTKNKDELIILFGHHSLATLNNNFNSGNTYDNDPQRILGDQFLRIMHQYPNIILYVCGHEHRSRIFPHKDCTGRTQGLWEVISPSHVDYPQQSRIFEIAESGDMLSIFTTMIDHTGPANVNRQKRSCCSTSLKCDSDTKTSCSSDSKSSECNSKTSECETSEYEKCREAYTIEEMASINRELSFNDIFIVDKFDDAVQRTGTKFDRNTELLIFNPLKRCKPCK